MKVRIFQRGIILFLISALMLPASGTLIASASGLERNLEAVTVPTPNSPSGMIFDTTPTYKWTKVTNATAYRYQLWQGTTLVYTKNTGSACGATTCARTPTNVLGYKNFKWRVRAKVGGVWSAWSDYLDFNVHNPNVPILVAPDGTIFDRTPTYKWNKVKNATAYRYQLWKGTTKIYTKTTGSNCGGTTCARTPTKLLAYNNYKWRARAKVGGVWKPWSGYYTFALNNPDVPKPLSPGGPTYDNTPKFTWTRAKDVKNYEIQVNKGTTQLYTVTYDATCGSATCSQTPGTLLDYGAHKWRVRVQKTNDVWKPWSTWKKFKNKVEYSDFNGTHDGWSIYGGNGTWAHESSQYYTSTGVFEGWSNIGFDTRTYSDVTYEVRMRRDGGDYSNPNRIIIRGTPNPLGTGTGDVLNDWASGYAFQYANQSNLSQGNFSVYKLDGTPADTQLAVDTSHPAINRGAGEWNILKVVASGDTFEFYINGSLVWTGTDSTYTSGMVGIGVYWTGSISKLYVDWAKFSDQALINVLAEMFVIPGIPVPGGTSTYSPSLTK